MRGLFAKGFSLHSVLDLVRLTLLGQNWALRKRDILERNGVMKQRTKKISDTDGVG